MQRGSIRVGRLVGIDINLHLSWFLIAVLLSVSLASHLLRVNAGWPLPQIWTAAVITVLALFAAIVAHEFSHALVARSRGAEVRSITLFALGGIAHLKRATADATTEFWMGIAGPIASAAIGGVALGVARLLGWDYGMTPATPGMVMLVWFGFINLSLAAFNMIPGFPLDGGRVLRAILWWRSGSPVRATRIAATIGQAAAMVFVAFGLLSFVSGGGFGGLWLAFAGLFLIDAARATAFDIAIREDLRGVHVVDIMSSDCETITRGAPITEAADQMLRTAKRCFFVVDNDRVIGLLTPQELRAVPRDRWEATSAGEAMKPIEQLHQVAADAPVTEALDAIADQDINQLPVLDHGRIRGVISRDQILRLIAVRTELAM
jgi:Zn-dependent protease/predicted transcriptional regulator